MLKRYLWVVFMILALVVTSCGPATSAPSTAEPQPPEAEEEVEQAPETTEAQYSEAPMLAEMVEAGELPPLEERLPSVPFVVGPGTLISEEDLPDWQPGQYGGTLNVGHSVANWNPDVFVMLDEALLQGVGIGMEGIQGNVVESFEVENDNRDFTFKIRPGLKWSDGVPVTTEDVRFTWEDMYGNEKLYPNGLPNEFRVGFSVDGEPGELAIIDDYTFKISFPKPYGGFIRNMWIEGWKGYTLIINPAHHLKQFHADYTPVEEMQAEMTEMNLTDEWWQYFSNKRCQNWDMSNPRCANYPGLYPWIIQESDNPSLLVWERNPYYFKVDTNGQQLPYIDKIVSQQTEDVEMLNLKALTGEIEFMRESTALVKIPLYKESEEQAGFRVILTDMHVDSSGIRLNQTFDDPDWREVVRDIRFRQAVSLAMDRQEIIDTVYYGYASLPLELVGEEYSQYDPDRANQLLDDMGLEKNADGIRTYPTSGEPINILLEHGAQAPDLIPVAELVGQYLQDVGINVTVKQIDPSLHGERWAANQIQATVMWSHDRGWDNDAVTGSVNRAGRLWRDWVQTGGEEGEEPPDWVMKAYDIDSRRWQAVSGSDEYKAIVEEGTAWCRENLPYINLVENVKYPMIASVDLGNIPQSGFAIAANFSGEQFFFKE
ncbi:MAG: ABC transporter substrate-binding protein [Anaerolineae bacterium]